MERTNSKNTLIGIALVGLIVVIGILAYNLKGNTNPNEKVVSVTGQSSTTIAPDKAEVYIKILTEGKSAEEVKNENSKINDNVVNALKDMGILSKDIETTQYYLSPKYIYDDGESKIDGYTLYNQLKVSTTELERVGRIIDKSIDNGANGIDQVSFVLTKEKEEQIKKEVLTKAASEAKSKAESIATGLGARLGDLVSVSESNFYYPPYIYAEAALKADIARVGNAESIEINPQKLEISASITAVYKIK